MFLQLVFSDIRLCAFVALPLFLLMISAVVMVQKILIRKLSVANFAFEIAVFAGASVDDSIVILKFAFVGEASAALFTLPFLRRFGSVATVVFFARVRFTNMAMQNVFGRIFLGTLVALPFSRLVHPVK